ncbi:uncharacterized protein [Maniola hyperantus]|uniref:uncharacterized protein n=1 Tax=Aphantopus hyperantus TaxID=2795564 RepID=UPI0037487576
MDCYTLVILASVAMLASGWSFPFFPVHRVPQLRVTRFAPIPHPQRLPNRPELYVRHPPKPKPERPKHDYDDYEDEEDDHDHINNDHDHKGNSGVIGPVHSFVKTDKNANYKWGVRHHVGNKHTS